MEALLNVDLARVSSERSEENMMISLVLMAEDQSPRRITACESDVVCTVMRQQYGEEFDGVLFGDEPIPEGDSFEDHAIEDGARLGVLLKPPVGFVAGDEVRFVDVDAKPSMNGMKGRVLFLSRGKSLVRGEFEGQIQNIRVAHDKLELVRRGVDSGRWCDLAFAKVFLRFQSNNFGTPLTSEEAVAFISSGGYKEGPYNQDQLTHMWAELRAARLNSDNDRLQKAVSPWGSEGRDRVGSSYTTS